MLVAFSAMMPARAVVPETHSCCQKKDAGKNKPCSPDKSKSNCCDNGLCNPFRPCTCCAFMVEKGVALEVVPPIADGMHYLPPADMGLLAQFVGSCFHPPEACLPA